jgi:hypothetical protein
VTNEEFEELKDGDVVRSDATGSEWVVTHRDGNMAVLTMTDVIDDESCERFSVVREPDAGPAFASLRTAG